MRVLSARVLWIAGAGALALASVGCEGLLGCTDAGCSDGVSIRLEGAEPDTGYVLTMLVEGEDPILLDCDSVYGWCEPRFGVELVPEELTLVLELDDTTISRTFEPRYRNYRPNGAHCDPVCRRADVTFTVE